MENLTKENCFDNLEAVYPESSKKFSQWIKNYFFYNRLNEVLLPGVTFLSLPLAFQMGILLTFFTEMELIEDGTKELVVNEDVIEGMDEMFKELEAKLI